MKSAQQQQTSPTNVAHVVNLKINQTKFGAHISMRCTASTSMWTWASNVFRPKLVVTDDTICKVSKSSRKTDSELSRLCHVACALVDDIINGGSETHEFDYCIRGQFLTAASDWTEKCRYYSLLRWLGKVSFQIIWQQHCRFNIKFFYTVFSLDQYCSSGP